MFKYHFFNNWIQIKLCVSNLYEIFNLVKCQKILKKYLIETILYNLQIH